MFQGGRRIVDHKTGPYRKEEHPSFRIVVLEKSKRRDGRYIDQLGHYNPKTDPASIHLDKEKYDFWVARGAQPTDTVKSFLGKIG